MLPGLRAIWQWLNANNVLLGEGSPFERLGRVHDCGVRGTQKVFLAVRLHEDAVREKRVLDPDERLERVLERGHVALYELPPNRDVRDWMLVLETKIDEDKLLDLFPGARITWFYYACTFTTLGHSLSFSSSVTRSHT